MNRISLHEQNHLLQNRERIEATLQQYPNVMNVGVGLKETGHALTNTLCYRVYVREKKPRTALQQQEIVPATIEGFTTDIIPYGVVDTCVYDDTLYRPLKGGIQIKQDIYGSGNRGIGTLGCLAVLNDGSGKIVGLTNEHVLRTHSLVGADDNQVGQPWKVVCCCCCTRNIIGKVLNSSEKPDCAIIELHDDIISEIQAGNTLHEIMEIGTFKGKARVGVGDKVKKRGVGSFLTHGIVKDIHFDGGNILIAPADGEDEFATYGDSGSIVLTEDNRVVGLLWGTKRDRFQGDNFAPDQPSIDIADEIPQRTHGVAAPIEKVEEEMEIIVATQETVGVTISVHPDDTETFLIPSVLPPEKNPDLHFVTVKGEGEVKLKATFDEAVAKDRIRWEASNVEVTFPDPNDITIITLDRGGEEGFKTTFTLFVDGFEVKKMDVWVIWTSSEHVVLDDPITITLHPSEVTAIRQFRQKFIIQPASIIPRDADDDCPDLRGSNTIAPPNVPDTDSDQVYNKGEDLSGGAIYKWDVSISIRSRIANPDFVILPQQGFNKKSFIHYPSSPLVGNYDLSANPIEHPYHESSLGELGLSIAIIHSVPHNTVPFDPAATRPKKLTFHFQYRVFARIELGGQWRMISHDRLGRFVVPFESRDELALNRDLNNDGDKLDFVWYTFYDLDSPDGAKFYLDNEEF